MILCDLPYGMTACAWDSVIPLEALWAHYRRIVKSRGAIVLAAVQPFTTTLIASNREWFKYVWAWKKTRPSDAMNAKNKPMRLHEDIIVFSPGTTANKSSRRMVYNPQGLVYKPTRHFRPNPTFKAGGVVGTRPSHITHTTGFVREYEHYPSSVLEFPNPNNDSLHPTQKPVALFAYLVRTYTNPGDLVLDNCIGSGTTAVACMQEGRRCLGIEKDPTFYAQACERVATTPLPFDFSAHAMERAQ
jgi:site-specific DNA-methyltransferase (adenine-specific)